VPQPVQADFTVIDGEACEVPVLVDLRHSFECITTTRRVEMLNRGRFAQIQTAGRRRHSRQQ